MKVLFLCTANSCRSQMAEGFAKQLFPHIEIASAGTSPGTLNPLAVQVMREVGIDISSGVSKSVESLGRQEWDLVVTVCDSAKENCPVFPGNKTLHQSFEDPPVLAEKFDSPEEKLNCYRDVRNSIEEFIKNTLKLDSDKGFTG